MLQKHGDLIRRYVHRKSGIYALYRRGKLYYVGLASNLRSRLSRHLRDRHQQKWDRFSVYLTVGDKHMRELESLLLRIVETDGNKQKGKFFCAENLHALLEADIRKEYEDRVNSYMGRKKKKIVPAKTRRRTAPTSGRKPVLGAYIKGPFILERKYKGKTLKARVRKDGTIYCEKKVFTSPSLAAKAATGRKTVNGWTFWRYEKRPGVWVRLDEMRK